MMAILRGIQESIVPVQLAQEVLRTQLPCHTLIDPVLHAAAIDVGHAHDPVWPHDILRYRLDTLAGPPPSLLSVRFLDAEPLQGHRVIIRNLGLADAADGVKCLVRRAVDAIAGISWIISRCTILPPKDFEKSPLKAGKVVCDWAAAPAIVDLGFNPVVSMQMFLYEHLDCFAHECQHPREIVYHPCQRIVPDLFVVTNGAGKLCLTSNLATLLAEHALGLVVDVNDQTLE
jgi:hypothetical protein